jgi:hypothetical protein
VHPRAAKRLEILVLLLLPWSVACSAQNSSDPFPSESQSSGSGGSSGSQGGSGSGSGGGSSSSSGGSSNGASSGGSSSGGSSSGGFDAGSGSGDDDSGGSSDDAADSGMAADVPSPGDDATAGEGGPPPVCDAGNSLNVNAPQLPEYMGPPVDPIIPADCPGDPTAGWTEYQDTFAIEHPYDLMPSDRFSRSCGIDTFWVLPTDKPHAVGNTTAPRTEARFSTFTSGMKMWSADVFIESGEKTVVMQCHTTTTGIGPAYIRVESGDLSEANGTKLLSNAIGKWFNMKVAIDHATYGATIWINNCQKFSGVNNRGNTEFYFKHGTYTCAQTGACKDHYKNVHLYQK